MTLRMWILDLAIGAVVAVTSGLVASDVALGIMNGFGWVTGLALGTWTYPPLMVALTRSLCRRRHVPAPPPPTHMEWLGALETYLFVAAAYMGMIAWYSHYHNTPVLPEWTFDMGGITAFLGVLVLCFAYHETRRRRKIAS